MMVRRLLLAVGAIMDPEDPSIEEWIGTRMNMGDPKAEWLQYQLETSARMQAQKIADDSDND